MGHKTYETLRMKRRSESTERGSSFFLFVRGTNCLPTYIGKQKVSNEQTKKLVFTLRRGLLLGGLQSHRLLGSIEQCMKYVD